ncbi:phosphoribosyl-ATP diphosphatase [Candidatus Bathyarchaeota archaeon]|nr:phosphoribosyl-ATP diphosphatase [Candidatus Bathyarchaeota archaeon]
MSWCFLDELYRIIEERRDKPIEGSYTNRLMSEGLEIIVDKILEECLELVEAAYKGSESDTVYEASDLIYHVLVLTAFIRIPSSKIPEELMKRRLSGHDGGKIRDK